MNWSLPGITIVSCVIIVALPNINIKLDLFWYPITKLEIHHFVKSKQPTIKGTYHIGLDRNGVPEHLTAPDWCGRRQADYQRGHTEHRTVSLPTATGKNQGCHYNLIYIRIRWVPFCNNALGGVEEAVEGIVGGLQIKEHLAYLTVIQLIGGRHAAEGGQPGRMNSRGKNEQTKSC